MNKTCKTTIRRINLADVDNIVTRLPKATADNAKRQLRKSLLTAYDSHKSSVIYEGKTETPDEKSKVLAWKQGLLDLQTEAFKSVPEKIKYYL
jgi:hypothetical protein